MKTFELPLAELTFTQKFDLLETIWDDLAGRGQSFESPAWHEDILRDLEKASSAGKLTVSDWEEAKERIRTNVSCK